MKTDESNIGIYLWLVLIFVINATWIGMDLWLRANHHEYLTTEFREGVKSGWWGLVLLLGIVITITVFVWHMYWQK